MPVGLSKFDVNRCNESPLRGEKLQFWPVSKFNTGSLRLRGILSVKIGVFCMSRLVCLRVVDSSNKYCVTVYGSILKRFSVLFKNGLFFQILHYNSSHFRCYMAPSSRNCSEKLRKVQKSVEKVVRTLSRPERFEENSTAVLYGQECRCAPI